MSQRQHVSVAVYLVLVRADGQLLLLRRAGTGWEDGRLSLPAGHVDAGESAIDAVARESLEEIGVRLPKENLTLVHTMHRRGEPDYLDLYFRATSWSGEPKIMEPDKASSLEWCDMGSLPGSMIASVAQAVRSIAARSRYSEFGWD